MAMGQLGKVMKATRTEMIESESDHVAELFTQRFGMTDGDYISYVDGWGVIRRGKIISVDDAFENSVGEYTALITVMPLLFSGKLGKTRDLTLHVNADGSGLRDHLRQAVTKL